MFEFQILSCGSILEVKCTIKISTYQYDMVYLFIKFSLHFI
jgi:hypothetical protein